MYLQFEDVSKIFKNYLARTNIVALNNISFKVQSGESILVTGKNGSGKSTLLRLASRMFKPSSGKIIFDESIKRSIRYCPDEPDLYGQVTVKDYFHLIKKFSTQKKPIPKIEDWIRDFELADWIEEPMKNLSRGTKYKVALITTLFDNPRLVLLDEPFSTLDEPSRITLSNIMIEFQEKGTSFMISDLKSIVEHKTTQIIAL